MTHRIRLRGPWDYQPLSRTVLMPDGSSCDEPGKLPEAGQVTMPTDWGESLGRDFRGRVRYVRRFNMPTGLDTGERVFLVIDQVDARAVVSLNEQPLGEIPSASSPGRFEITGRMARYNELAVDVDLPRLNSTSPPLDRAGRNDEPGGLVGEVRLEIETND